MYSETWDFVEQWGWGAFLSWDCWLILFASLVSGLGLRGYKVLPFFMS